MIVLDKSRNSWYQTSYNQITELHLSIVEFSCEAESGLVASEFLSSPLISVWVFYRSENCSQAASFLCQNCSSFCIYCVREEQTQYIRNIEPYLCLLSVLCIGTSGIFSRYLSSKNLKFSTWSHQLKRLLHLVSFYPR